MLQLRLPINFRDAALLMTCLPVSSLAVLATVQHKAAPRARQKLNSTSFRLETMAADIALTTRFFLLLLPKG